MVILVVLLAVIHIIRCNPLLLMGIRLESHLNIPVISFERVPHFFICTHDYEHVDLIAIGRETQLVEAYDRIEFDADRCRSLQIVLITSYMTHSPKKNANCLYARKNTVATVIETLRTRHVVIFIYRHATGTGLYHMLSGHGGPCKLIRVLSDAERCRVRENGIFDCVYNTWCNSYAMKYEQFEYKNLLRVQSPTQFMTSVKSRLYFDAVLNSI